MIRLQEEKFVTRAFGAIVGALVMVACSGCGGSSSVSKTASTSPTLPYAYGGQMFTLADGSQLFLLMSPSFGPVTGEAQLVPPVGSSNPIELFDVSGSISGNTLTVDLNEDVANGNNAYTVTGEFRGTTFQLAPGTSRDALNEPAQTINGTVMVPPWSGGPQTTKPFSSKVTVSAGGSANTWNIVNAVSITQQSSAFNSSVGVGGTIYICQFGGQNWGWFDAYVGDTKVATGPLVSPSTTGGQLSMTSGGSATTLASGSGWTSATMQITGGSPSLSISDN